MSAMCQQGTSFDYVIRPDKKRGWHFQAERSRRFQIDEKLEFRWLLNWKLCGICGSDLWPYNDLAPVAGGRRMGHEAIGLVEDVGKDVRRMKRGDLVIMPFACSDGTCVFCH